MWLTELYGIERELIIEVDRVKVLGLGVGLSVV
jgi:hypothetical protein